MIFALKSGVWFGFGRCKYFAGSNWKVNSMSTLSPATTTPPTACGSGTVIDIARKFGEVGCGAPSGPMKLAGITTNVGFFGSENLLGRIGSPVLIDWTVIRPIASLACDSAASGFASRLKSWSLRSAAVSVVFAGISRAATSTWVVGTATGWSVFAPDAYTNVPTP